MAQKRMFDKTITNSDAFIDMPDSSQNLYFHLSMNADDDGFVNNWKSIMRMTGHKEDDLKVLISKQFVIPFESGVIVIKHWRINNYLRNDRYVETKFKEEKELLSLDENMVYQLDTSGRHSIDKNSIVKNNIDNNIYTPNFEEEFASLWKQYPKKIDKSGAFHYYKEYRKKGTTYEEVKEGLERYLDYCKKNEWYSPRDGIRWFKKKGWEDDYTIEQERKESLDEWAARMEREDEERRKRNEL